jgi:hypothetical protein
MGSTTRDDFMMGRTILFTSAVISVFSIASAEADPASFVGRWHWSRAESSLAPGEPAPKDILLNITDTANGRLKWTLTEVDPAGQSHVQSFDGASNGTPTKVTGSDDGTTAGFTLGADALKAVFRGPQGESDSWGCALSADQRKMTCKGTESDGKGHSMNYTDVYDRS